MKLIPLSQGKFAQVDDADYGYLSQFNWIFLAPRYAYRHVRREDNSRTILLMHREIMKTPKGMDTDHIDGSGLNNQRSNLRNCTRAQNLRNNRKSENWSSQFKGVSWDKRRKKWRAEIIQKTLGYFSSEKEAATAYDRAALEKFGEYAYLNFGVPNG